MIIADREFHKIMITGDREFHSIFLSHWLKKYQRPDVYFVLRQKNKP